MAAVATKVKECKRLVHNGTERVPCGTEYKGADCPRRDHVLKFKTGFCNNGDCEGNKPKTWRGKPKPTCKFWQTCPCECHKRIDDMFKMAEMPRQLIENPEYIPEKVHFDIMDYMKTSDEAVPFSPLATSGPDGVEGHAPDAPRPAAAPLAARRTDTGRAARGGLEAQVWEQCQVFAAGGIEATPKVLADLIADKYKIPTPSTGAIGAVFNRWEKIGFAKQGKKPIRFLGFTGEGTWQELEVIKAKAKRTRKQTQSAARRGFR
jgi:hypothetical protein